MYATTAAYPDIIRGGHVYTGVAEAWYGGQPVPVDDGIGNTTTSLPLDLAGQNSVTVDGATPGNRRICNLTLVKYPDLWEQLSPIGTELRVRVEVRPYPSGPAVSIPQGVFLVDVIRDNFGTLSVTAPDRWSLIRNARFLTPRTFGGQTARDLIAQLLREVLPATINITDIATGNYTVPTQTEERDRAGFIQKLATAASLDVYFDRIGNVVIRNAPTLNTISPAWEVDYGGVLIAADRERNRQRTYNLVVINGTNSDGTVVFPTQYVWDNDPRSATYAGPGQGFGPNPPDGSLAGPFGVRPTFYSSPLLTSAEQAQQAGRTILNRVTGLAAQLTANAIPNPALDDGDTIRVTLPPVNKRSTQPVEYHLVDGFSVPLIGGGSGQSISTRSTRPDDVDET